MVTAWGIWSLQRAPLGALPDLSDVQVIIRTSYPGQAPQIVENQVTYPLTTTMLSVRGAKTVRGYSFFGDSFVCILFEEGTDPYWARSRVLEHAWEDRVGAGQHTEADLLDAIREGAVLRVRPKAMTVAVIIAGLIPIVIGSGTGSEIMQRIAAPMVGGMVTAPLSSMFVVPAVYLLLRRRELRRQGAEDQTRHTFA